MQKHKTQEVATSDSGKALFEPFHDIEFEIEIRVGRIRLSVGELLGMAEGDLITLDRLSSDNVLLLIDDQIVGEAEVIPTKKGTSARVVDIR